MNLKWTALAFWLFCGLTVTSSCAGPDGFREISVEELRDKIRGGWAGQMIGVSYGAPTEFRYREAMIPESDLPEWRPDRVANSIRQDDLYVEMTFARVLDDVGLDATTEDFGDMFRDSRYSLWHANLAARRALRRGVPATESGTPEFNAHANDIDFQIESDFIGLMCPGLPQASNDLAWRAGRVMNSGDGIYGGMFVSCMYSAAFFEKDVRQVVESGLACIPASSPYARTIRDVLDWSRESPGDWAVVWQRIEDKWNDRDPCPDGALRDFNIDAKLNGAYIALGLLYGGKEVGRTMSVSTRAGQDSDCNPSNAAGILGVMLGWEGIPDIWKQGISAIADEKFSYTDYTFETIVDSTLKRAVEMAKRNGGSLEGETLRIRAQTPKATDVGLWDDYGSPAERIGVDDPRWSWKGAWEREVVEGRASHKSSRFARQKGAEAQVTFRGTGAVLVGPYLPDGGKADIYLDGTYRRTIDVNSDEEHGKGGEAVWHIFGLEAGPHSLGVIVRGEPFADREGTVVRLEDLVVFDH